MATPRCGTGPHGIPTGAGNILRTATNRTCIGLVLAAILGLIPGSTFSASPSEPSARTPSSRPEATDRPIPTEGALPEHDLAIRRPSGAAGPPAGPAATEAPTAEPRPAIQLMAVTPQTIDVWNAEERYFSVTGSTPDEIVAAAKASVPADPGGADRTTMAYVGPTVWDHRPSYVQDPATGSCTMTAVASTVRYQATLPQWVASSSVPQELDAWWRIVLDHIRVHESEHVHIFDAYVRDLPDRVVGQRCDAWDGIIGRWSSELLAAQSAFDAAEERWELPAYTGPLDW